MKLTHREMLDRNISYLAKLNHLAAAPTLQPVVGLATIAAVDEVKRFLLRAPRADSLDSRAASVRLLQRLSKRSSKWVRRAHAQIDCSLGRGTPYGVRPNPPRLVDPARLAANDWPTLGKRLQHAVCAGLTHTAAVSVLTSPLQIPSVVSAIRRAAATGSVAHSAGRASGSALSVMVGSTPPGLALWLGVYIALTLAVSFTSVNSVQGRVARTAAGVVAFANHLLIWLTLAAFLLVCDLGLRCKDSLLAARTAGHARLDGQAANGTTARQAVFVQTEHFLQRLVRSPPATVH